MKNALLIIDVQKYFIEDSTKHIPKKIEDYVSKNKDKFDLIIIQRFNNNETTPFYKMGWKNMMTSPETDLCLEINVSHKEFVRSCRSCLRDEKFKKFLEDNEIGELFLCGLNTDECIISTAFDACDLGYFINVIKNLCASYNGKDFHDAAMKLLEEQFEVI